MSDVINVVFVPEQEGEAKKRGEERKEKSEKSQKETGSRSAVGAAASENFLAQTWISSGCSQSSATCNDLLSPLC